uniref:Protein kinase domain-containing protein n=1 Tax=Loa loa TaxID=7209 RepID=A0A1I7VC21_LOALO
MLYKLVSRRSCKLIALKELADLSQVEDGYSTEGFVQLKGAMVVKGRYPSSMINAWKQYKRSMKSDKITTMLQAYSIVYQLFMAIAVAEIRLSFEHRDLNSGNVLITSADWHDIISMILEASLTARKYTYMHTVPESKS